MISVITDAMDNRDPLHSLRMTARWVDLKTYPKTKQRRKLPGGLLRLRRQEIPAGHLAGRDGNGEHLQIGQRGYFVTQARVRHLPHGFAALRVAGRYPAADHLFARKGQELGRNVGIAPQDLRKGRRRIPLQEIVPAP